MLATTGIPIYFILFCRIQRTRLEEGGQNDDNVYTSPCACHIATLSRHSDDVGLGGCGCPNSGYNLDNTGLTVAKKWWRATRAATT